MLMSAGVACGIARGEIQQSKANATKDIAGDGDEAQNIFLTWSIHSSTENGIHFCGWRDQTRP